jgi:hypothetical protein
MISHWKHKGKVYYATTHLDTFAEKGFGTFFALEASRSRPIGSNRCAFDLEPTTLSYLWEVADGDNFKLYSKFEFKRNGALAGGNLTAPIHQTTCKSKGHKRWQHQDREHRRRSLCREWHMWWRSVVARVGWAKPRSR